MSSEQKEKHLAKVFTMCCMPFEVSIDVSFTAANAAPLAVAKHLSVPPERCRITTISSELLVSTWKKAEKLLNTSGNLCPTPGMSDAMCVASDTGCKPHIVSKTEKKVLHVMMDAWHGSQTNSVLMSWQLLRNGSA